MDLRQFITETVRSIVEATIELQGDLSHKGAIVNPHNGFSDGSWIEVGKNQSLRRRVQSVQFDVALSAASETTGSGKAGLKLAVLEFGVDTGGVKSKEQVSRVQFEIALALPPTSVEDEIKANQIAPITYDPPKVV